MFKCKENYTHANLKGHGALFSLLINVLDLRIVLSNHDFFSNHVVAITN